MSIKTLFDIELNQSPLSAKSKLQKHLEGLSHYADDDTLKSFNSKIVECTVMANGKLLGAIERLPVGSFDATPSYLCVFFSIDGMVIRDQDLQEVNTKKNAIKTFWALANELDEDAIYKNALQNLIKWHNRDIERLKIALAEVTQ